MNNNKKKNNKYIPGTIRTAYHRAINNNNNYNNNNLNNKINIQKNQNNLKKKNFIKNEKNKNKNTDLLLNASAFQDHISSTMNMNIGILSLRQLKLKKKNELKLKKNALLNYNKLQNQQNINNNNNNNNNEEEEEEESKYLSWDCDDRWTCETCTLLNRGTINRCAACLRPRNGYNNNNNNLSLPGEEDYIRSMTLAEKRGLINLPENIILTREQWKEIEIQTWKRLIRKSRLCHKNDLPVCPICLDQFKNGIQILLSCSHIFHQNCIASFERFSRSSDRICPLCRKINYQKKKTKMGTIAHKHYCVTLIQTFIRSKLKRKQYIIILRELYKKGGGNAICRRKFLLNEMESFSNKMNNHIQNTEDNLDLLFSQFDENIKNTRKILTESSFQYLRNRNEGEDIILQSLINNNNNENNNNNNEIKFNEFWNDIIIDVKKRENPDCAICMNEFYNSISNNKQQVITSCSHVFHKNCLETFENFKGNEIPFCPLCRSLYSKLEYNVYIYNHNNNNNSNIENNNNNDDILKEEIDIDLEIIESIPWDNNNLIIEN